MHKLNRNKIQNRESILNPKDSHPKYLLIYLPIHPPIQLSIYLFNYPSIHLTLKFNIDCPGPLDEGAH